MSTGCMYSTGEERWKERMRRRIADRIASDEEKAELLLQGGRGERGDSEG